MEKNYKAETIKSLKEGMDEEFMKGRDAKGIWDTDPGKLHKEVRDYQINKEGVTSENYKEFKEKDKEKLERVLSYLEDLVEHKLADEKQIEFKKQLSYQIDNLKTTNPPSSDEKGEEGKGDGKGEEGKGDGKGEEGKGDGKGEE